MSKVIACLLIAILAVGLVWMVTSKPAEDPLRPSVVTPSTKTSIKVQGDQKPVKDQPSPSDFPLVVEAETDKLVLNPDAKLNLTITRFILRGAVENLSRKLLDRAKLEWDMVEGDETATSLFSSRTGEGRGGPEAPAEAVPLPTKIAVPLRPSFADYKGRIFPGTYDVHLVITAYQIVLRSKPFRLKLINPPECPAIEVKMLNTEPIRAGSTLDLDMIFTRTDGKPVILSKEEFKDVEVSWVRTLEGEIMHTARSGTMELSGLNPENPSRIRATGRIAVQSIFSIDEKVVPASYRARLLVSTKFGVAQSQPFALEIK